MSSAVLCRVRVDFADESEALDRVREAAMAGRPLGVHFVNAYTLSLADADPAYRAVLERGDLNLPDGRPLAWAASRDVVPGARQVCGPDFMLRAMQDGEGLRHYLYGSAPQIVQQLKERLEARYPDAEIVAAESPPFRPLTDTERSELKERVRASGANVVWVGLGTPKQDVFVEEMKDSLSIPLLAVGAAFDFHAGVKSRPPAWISDLGMEWAYRFAAEPRRLWKRYLVGNTRFLAALARDGVKPV